MSRAQRLLILLTLAALLMIMGGFTIGSTYGIARTTSNGQDYESVAPHYPFIYFDGLDFLWFDHRQQADRITFDGYLWRDSISETTWRILHTGGVRLTIDDRVVFEHPRRLIQARIDEITLSFESQAVKLHAEYRTDILQQLAPFHEASITDYIQARGGREVMFAIHERDALGAWRLLPTHQLYTALPDSSQAQTRTLIAGLSLFGKLLMVVSLVGSMVMLVRQQRLLHSPVTRWALMIFVVALAVRLIVLWERSLTDGMFSFSNPDSDNYVMMARRTLGGNNFFAPSFYQPGSILWYLGLTVLFGPHPGILYIVNAVGSALGAVIIFMVGLEIRGGRAAVLSGFLAALFAPWVFHTTTLQDGTLTSLVVPLVMLATLKVFHSLNIRWALVLGVGIGLGTLTRILTALMGVTYATTLLFIQWPRINRTVLLGVISGGIALLVIAPQTLMNMRAGQPALVTVNGSLVLYAGNTRDSDGTVGGQALYVALARDQAFEDALKADIEADRLRSLELVLHKWGTFWGNYDIPANVDFYVQGLQSSAMLRVLDLGGLFGTSLLLVVGITGFGLMLIEKNTRTFALWLLLSLSLITFFSVIFAVAGRMRISIWPLLFVGAAFALDTLWRRFYLRRTLILLALSGAMVLMVAYFEHHLPYKRYWMGDLPADSVTRNESFDESLRLLGHAPLETDFNAGGYIYLTAYWDVTAPTKTNQEVSVLVMDADGQEHARLDVPLGSITYPSVGTAQWPRDGARLRESYLVNLPEDIGNTFSVVIKVADAAPVMLAEVTLDPPNITYYSSSPP